ncbi:class I SAM-dependent methyltransferase [Bradyrhizobium mercantei]|uniref:class I SAM-dependent methyltransferase n=1 Tax=Bradyrhizobium mercantei TaxID=1904807 RepID=UPI000976EDBE|nr:class I SAM-dependent methyltransferase [Bradyrhizobium mercantei]
MTDTVSGFTNNWFDVTARLVWDQLIPQIRPERILEIGSYEGASACYLIDACASQRPIEIQCIDTWEGGSEHKADGVNMSAVEIRFQNNVADAAKRAQHPVKLIARKGRSTDQLAKLIGEGFKQYFDMIYIDGSHEAPDVLADAVLSFELLKVGGHMVFDDYLWRHPNAPFKDILDTPKPAVDAFLNLYFHRMRLIWSPNSQVVAKRFC